MAGTGGNRLRLFHLYRILCEETDESHYLTLREILEKLEERGVHTDRKLVYQDIHDLREGGVDIMGEHEGRCYYYYLASREFELVELKLLIDCVQTSKFITEKKSRELIEKLKTLTSRSSARAIQSQVEISGSIKTTNEEIYYNIDKLHSAITEDKQIGFQYFQWHLRRDETGNALMDQSSGVWEKVMRHDGAIYRVSPWQLVWDDQNYYLVAYDAKADMIKHYRIDKMQGVELIDQPREGRDCFLENHTANYATHNFRMFSGTTTKLRIHARNDMAGVIRDSFGNDGEVVEVDPDGFTLEVDVALTDMFVGWIVGLGDGVRIIGPEEAVRKVKDTTKRLYNQYLREPV